MREIPIRLPGGYVVQAEVAENLGRGLMERTSVAPGGMLFVHPRSGFHHYWMNRVLIPLDIVWLDSLGKIVELVENAQPGAMKPLGGHRRSKFALELAGGMARRYKLQPGQKLEIGAPISEVA